ncbi:hypothetical protein DFH29DRAFT_588620 [Suillus ampliporus]|nr:hypothetical protein DFH29DRAFT_588620 [Suillus ampliporus]
MQEKLPSSRGFAAHGRTQKSEIVLGETIDPNVLKESRERGEHDIENEMVFSSNEGFVFHDSRGLEAGGEAEFNKMKAFYRRPF